MNKAKERKDDAHLADDDGIVGLALYLAQVQLHSDYEHEKCQSYLADKLKR